MFIFGMGKAEREWMHAREGGTLRGANARARSPERVSVETIIIQAGIT